MSKPTSTGQMPVYIPAGTVGSPLNSTKVSAAPRGSAFASVTNGVLMPDQSSGPVVTTHNGNGALLDVNENADLGLDLFDVIDVYHANEAYKQQNAGELQVANEMLMLAATFQRRFEPRNSAQTVTPPVPLFANFQFPRNAAWHFVSTDGVQKGPDPNDPKIFDLRKKVTVSAVSHLESTLGNPVPLAFNLGAEVSKWHRNVRVFIRRTDAVRETPNENMLPVVNYSWLAHAYRYMRTIYTERYRWENIWRTVFQNINSYLMGGDQRTHFVFVDLPKVLVGIEKMRRLITAPPQTLIRTITDDQQWMIFELWKWIDPEIRHTSMLSAIDPQVLDRVRIVLVDGARFTVFNPKSINDWTIDPRDLSRKTATITGVQMQRRFLRGCMTVMEYRNPEVDNSADGREGVIEADSDMASPRDGEDHTQARSSQVEQAQTPEGVAPGSLAPLERDGEMGQSDASIDQSMVSSAAKRAESILLTMDDDLAALDEIDDMKSLDLDKVLDAKIEESSLLPQTPAKSSFDFEMTVQDDLTKRVETLADRGAITVVDYRKLNRLIEKSKTLPSAYASGATMVEFAAVKQEETQLDMAEKLPDRNTVTEKTMLQNSLRNYNKRYIEEVLPRDITAMLLQVQSGGAIITDHQIEIQEDAMNAYEFHTVRYQPIEGVSTPLRFKIPVLSKTGRMKSNGTISVARMQRVDLPIRKVAYNRVALSSYYGKNFVNLNERSAYNYDVWMSKEVMLKSIGDAPQIEHALTGDVFDHTLDAPRAFSALSHGYRTFRCAGVDFFFDKKLRDKAFKPELYEVLAQDKLFPVGRKGEVVYALDENNTLYECKPGENTPIDSIENFLGLRSENLPLEHAVCRIFSKDVPVGLVLGYYYGFNELIKMLGARVRYVPTGTRVNAAPSEWSLAFEDQTVVFSRDDRLATLIFGGLKNAEKALKRYALALFDQPAVYFQVIEYMGMTGRMIREFDNLRNMFIDPITRRVLVKMGEPTTYPGLIKRACELLLTSKCSRKLDMREMRVRGTERIAGAIYTEMVNTMRAHNAKVSKASAKLDLHPYDIWNSITRDRSVVQVKDINPINALKEVEAVTFSGNGGRSSQTMMKEDRYFDPTDMGLIGESTPDSSEVGVSTYTVGVPRFANMEGMILPPEFDKTDAPSLLTTTALISPSSMKDDYEVLLKALWSNGVEMRY